MEFQDELAGGTVLVRPALQSPDYLTRVSGWAIKIDGSAEFNNVIIRGGTTTGGKALYYDGTPAAGNLIASVSANSGTDEFGNTYLGGIYSYTGPGFTGLTTGNLLVGITASSSKAGGIGLYSDYGLSATSAFTTANPDIAGWTALSGVRSTTPLSAEAYPHTRFNGAIWVESPILWAVSNANTWTAESWHTPSYNANWSGTSTFGTISGGLGTLRYRKDAEDNLHILGCFTAAAGAGNSVFQLPTGYKPTTNYPFPVAFISSGGVAGNAWMYISTAGNLNINSQLGSTTTAGTVYVVNAKIPLGNIA